MRSLHDNGLTESDNEPMYPDDRIAIIGDGIPVRIETRGDGLTLYIGTARLCTVEGNDEADELIDGINKEIDYWRAS